MHLGRQRSARLRWLAGALLGAALLASPAQGAPAAGGAQASLNVPVPTTARIEANNTLRVCFNLPVGAVVNPKSIRVSGYDVNREAPATSATLSGTSRDCVVAQFANGGNDAPLTDFTRASVEGGAIKGTDGHLNVGGGLTLDGTAQTPRSGFTGGPDLVGTPTVSPPQGGNVTITYTFDQALDATPTVVPPGVFNSPTNITDAFGYYGAAGTVVSCGPLSAMASPGVSISGDTVTCRIPAATAATTPPARFFVLGTAVRDRPTAFSCCDVNPTGSAGDLTTRPVIRSVTQTGPTQATVTYNQPVTIRDARQFQLYTSDGTAIAPSSSSQPAGNTSQVVLDFPAQFANVAYKVVGLADPGAAGPNGGAVQSRALSGQSATSYSPIRTAPISAGRVDGPDLSAVSVNPAAGTATFTFHGLVAGISTARGALGVADFHLLDQAGNVTSGLKQVGAIGLDPSTGADPTSRVTISFPAAAIANARAAQILDGDVVDFQLKNGARNTVAISNSVIATTGKAKDVKATSATLTGSVNPEGRATTYYFQYGRTAKYGLRTTKRSAGSGNAARSVSAAIRGLRPNTTYHFRIVASNSRGTSTGRDRTLRTRRRGPSARTRPAGHVRATRAVLHGAVNPEGSKTSYRFQYGRTKHYGARTAARGAGSGTSPRSVAALIRGLRPNTTYHFRVVAWSSRGTARGRDLTFHTRRAMRPARFTG